MSIASVANVALTLRVMLLGGFLLVLPRIVRKGLLFGTYVGEECAESDSARRLLRSWERGCLAAMALGLAVGWGISLAGAPVAGNLTGTVTLLAAVLALYLRTHSKARAMASPDADRQSRRATATLEASVPRASRFAKLALGICVLAGLATVAHAAVGYAAMPARVPPVTGGDGPQGLVDKSIVAVMLAPALNLLLSTLFASIGVLTASAKRSLRGGSGGRSIEVQDAFRATMANLSSWAALLMCALLSLVSVQVVRIGLSQTRSLGVGVWVLAGVFLVFTLGGLVRVFGRHGQGGALRERGSVETPLTGGLADNARWVWGLFYVDRTDPSIMVEKRFGYGYTLNYGNWQAVLIAIAFALLTLGLVGVALLATVAR